MIDRAAIGAVGEMLAASDLVRRGYFVYRNVSATGPCDLVAFRRGEAPIKIEVKVGHVYGGTGRLYFTPPGERHEYDVLAVVLLDGSVEYRPPGLISDIGVS